MEKYKNYKTYENLQMKCNQYSKMGRFAKEKITYVEMSGTIWLLRQYWHHGSHSLRSVLFSVLDREESSFQLLHYLLESWVDSSSIILSLNRLDEHNKTTCSAIFWNVSPWPSNFLSEWTLLLNPQTSLSGPIKILCLSNSNNFYSVSSCSVRGGGIEEYMRLKIINAYTTFLLKLNHLLG